MPSDFCPTVTCSPAGTWVPLEVLTTAEFDRTYGFPLVPHLISVSEAAVLRRITRQAVVHRNYA